MSYEIGKKLIKQKQYKKAFYIFSKLLEKNSRDLRANFQMGKIYYELNSLNKSLFFFEKCNKIQPNTPNIIFNLALIYQSIGKIKEARKQYLNLIAINSNDIKSYYGLSILDIGFIEPKLYNNLEKIIKDNKISLFEKSLINFIFSKCEKKKNELDKEIEYLKLAHQNCYEANTVYNEQSDFYYKKIISRNFNQIIFQEKFEVIPEFNNSNHIFIIGLPRSGSSLVETIIAHNEPRITPVGEFHGINTSILDQIGKTILSKDFNHKDFILSINQKKFQDSLLEKYDNFENKFYLDKSLENFFNIEIILKFFPNAKFIHTYRSTNDSIIGIYQTMLPELSWSHKIQDIIDYIDIYKEIISYFKKKYPNKIIDVELSELSNNKEKETKKILEFCNIKFNSNYLDFDKNNKLFNKTNSFLQVKKKITKYENTKYQPYFYLLNKDIN
jgi:hypothetical protein